MILYKDIEMESQCQNKRVIFIETGNTPQQKNKPYPQNCEHGRQYILYRFYFYAFIFAKYSLLALRTLGLKIRILIMVGNAIRP